MKRLFNILLLVLLFAIGLSFSVINADSVTLNYYLASIDLPLALVVIVTLSLGVLFGALVSLTIILTLKAECGRLHKKMAIAEKEVKNLREIPIKNSR